MRDCSPSLCASGQGAAVYQSVPLTRTRLQSLCPSAQNKELQSVSQSVSLSVWTRSCSPSFCLSDQDKGLQSISLSACLSVCVLRTSCCSPSVYLPVCQSVCLGQGAAVHQSVCLSVCLSGQGAAFCQSVCVLGTRSCSPSVCQSVCVFSTRCCSTSVCLPVCLSGQGAAVCLSVHVLRTRSCSLSVHLTRTSGCSPSVCPSDQDKGLQSVSLSTTHSAVRAVRRCPLTTAGAHPRGVTRWPGRAGCAPASGTGAAGTAAVPAPRPLLSMEGIAAIPGGIPAATSTHRGQHGARPDPVLGAGGSLGTHSPEGTGNVSIQRGPGSCASIPCVSRCSA
ncbi:keratin-associated protein 10-6-like [Melospiza georgiana]|uniref:keratin-associated protein 10-6-like n=1 Tax=Melospiza georgiana TaxID=44398 RepID=UPI0025ACC0C8|nr:keratin-associated protein 10-6-like [Melospiza georgiana]